MSKRSDLQDYLKRILPPEEQVVVATFGQVKGGLKKQLGKTVAKGVAASLAVAGGTSGLLVVAVPPTAWIVVTSQRLLLIETLESGRRLGEVFLDAPREALTGR